MGSTTVDVSVIVPVYNAGPYLQECLDSLVGQQLDGLTMEIIAVNDGSTDGSGQLLDLYANQHEYLSVVHQENSGWAGMPRNVGLELAQGRYVFFCDADDYLGSEALARMVAFADQHQSDVVIPKLIGITGRWIRKSIYRETQIDADLLRASQSSGPTKLFRRSVIDSHSVRFPEDKMPAEDTIFLFRMFTLARRVSILADYDYYFVRLREDAGNISFQRTDPFVYSQSLINASSIVEGSLRNRGIERAIILELFRRVGLNKYAENFAKADVTRQHQWVQAHQPLLDRFLPPGSEAALRFPQRERMALVREGRVQDLVSMSTLSKNPKVASALGGFRRGKNGISFSGTVQLEGQFRRFDAVRLEFRSRETGGTLSFLSALGTLALEPDASIFTPPYEKFAVHVEESFIKALPPGTWDLFTNVTADGREYKGRLAVDTSANLHVTHISASFVRPYRTKHGNLSLEISNQKPPRPLHLRAVRRLRRFARIKPSTFFSPQRGISTPER